MSAPQRDEVKPRPGAHAQLPSGALYTTLSATAGMGAGIIFALLVAAKFGSTAGTDGFFIAYGVFGTFVGLAQGWRTTLVARLVESETTFGTFNRCLGAVILISAAAGIVLAGLGSPVATVLTGDLGATQETARTALLILWPAAAAQLFAGLAASMLGVLGDFVQAAKSYAVGSIVGVLSFLALEPEFGIDATAAGVLIGSMTSAALITFALVRAGWRPGVAILPKSVANLRAAWLLIYSSLSILGSQVLTVIVVSAAARLGEGSATLYSYANTAQGALKGLVSMSLPVVLAASLATTWNRRPAALRPYMDDALRTGLVLLIPAVATAAFLGNELGEALLGKFSAEGVHQILTVFLILSASIVTAQAAMIQRTALMTLGRYGVLAVLPIAQAVLLVPLCVAAVAIGSLAALAGAVVISFAIGAVVTVALIHGRRFAAVWAHVAKEVLRIALPAAVCFGVAAFVSRSLSAPFDDIAGLAGGLALYAATVAAFMPPYRVLASRLVRSVRLSPAAGR